MSLSRIAYAAVAVGVVMAPGAAMAGKVVANVPAPGILGLVAVGVVAAIAVARSRK